MDYLGRPTKRIRREAVVTLKEADTRNSDSVTALQTQLYGEITDLQSMDLDLQGQINVNDSRLSAVEPILGGHTENIAVLASKDLNSTRTKGGSTVIK